MEQYTTATTTTGEQIVVQTSNGQIQQQVQGQPLMVQVSGGQLITSSGQPIMVQAMSGGQGQTIMQVPVSGAQGLQQIQLVQPGQIQLQGGQTLQLQGQQGQPQQIIIQQPQTAITAGQNQGQQISLQGQQVAQTADGQTIVYQPVNADGTILQQGMITIPAASLAGAQIVQAGGANTNTTNSGQGTVTVTLPVSGNMVNAGGMVMMVPGGGAVPTMQRIPLPGAEMLEEEPLYVNAKQYHRILKRRQARAKLEAEGKIPKERRVRRERSFSYTTLNFSFSLPAKCKCTCFKPLFLSSPATHLFCLSMILFWSFGESKMKSRQLHEAGIDSNPLCPCKG
ncbi:nuclear transcription factor Y, alpha, like isoform X9 [Etheostoma spectabile]|uniref:nuclear transcription factor Y, alpha, like isoform X9 n=1 Tax=Etheostoma spectabile TaxID=54343 RepID=UPI0013AEF0ED|nr:nuclear transcription factor Y subunit alpha isoform X9 [Etheostoma spectabile]